MKKLMVLAFVAASVGQVYAAGVEQGEWEFSVKTDLQDMPPSQHPLKLKKCLSEKDAANPLQFLPLAPGATPETCSVKEQKQSGAKLHYVLECPGMPNVTTTGDVSITAGNISGNAVTHLESVTYKKQLTQQYSGKRIGKCQ
jgi:hypothetical protein